VKEVAGCCKGRIIGWGYYGRRGERGKGERIWGVGMKDVFLGRLGEFWNRLEWLYLGGLG
jgi:hypothetical protein